MTTIEAALLFGTIWLAVFAWAGTEVLKTAGAGYRAPARAIWTAGAFLLVIHSAAAFHFRHGWSHADALVATARQSEALTGVAAGWGLYLNYLLVLVWVTDAAWWWASPRACDARPRWIERAIFGFFLFMMINGAVVFATSAMWMAGAAAVLLACVAFVRRESRRARLGA